MISRLCTFLLSGNLNPTKPRTSLDMMKLPAISTATTPVGVPQETHPVRQSRCPVLLPISGALIPDQLGTSAQTIPRLDPLHPPLVERRTVSLETPAVHHHNHQRALLMQRSEYNRFHQVWQKPFYGTSKEREEYRRELREHLKRQIEEKCVRLKLQLASREQEAESLREVDRLDLSTDRQQRLRHSKAMSVYRDENKKLMEQCWRNRALTRSQEALKERELLRLNPINWSGTLK